MRSFDDDFISATSMPIGFAYAGYETPLGDGGSPSTEVTATINGQVQFTSTDETYSTNAPIQIRSFIVSGGTTEGVLTLNEGVDANGLADGLGGAVVNVYMAIGKALEIDFEEALLLADKGLKLTSLPEGASVRVVLA